jgi:hypothetical protein
MRRPQTHIVNPIPPLNISAHQWPSVVSTPALSPRLAPISGDERFTTEFALSGFQKTKAAPKGGLIITSNGFGRDQSDDANFCASNKIGTRILASTFLPSFWGGW